ncbi:MAG: hypothetical protein ACQEXJ_07340 [Myxococcota bacterium]
MIRRNPVFLVGLFMAATSLLFIACDDDGDDNGGTPDVTEDVQQDVPEQDVPEQDVPEQDVPEQDVPEQDVPEQDVDDDTATGEGACTNTADFQIITTEPTTEQCADCPGGDGCDTPPQMTVTAVAQEEGVNCIAAPDAVECSRPEIEARTGITSDCATCYAELISCAIDECLAECGAAPDSQACTDCRADNCNDAFFTCSGLTGDDTDTAGCE